MNVFVILYIDTEIHIFTQMADRRYKSICFGEIIPPTLVSFGGKTLEEQPWAVANPISNCRCRQGISADAHQVGTVGEGIRFLKVRCNILECYIYVIHVHITSTRLQDKWMFGANMTCGHLILSETQYSHGILPKMVSFCEIGGRNAQQHS